MKKLRKNPKRLPQSHPRFPHELVARTKGKLVKCEFCGRFPLVSGFDFFRVVEGKNEACCNECYQENRLGRLGMALAGLDADGKDSEFPLGPKKGTPRRKQVGRSCATCCKPIYWNPHTRKLIGAYNELIRGITVHRKCGIPKQA